MDTKYSFYRRKLQNLETLRDKIGKSMDSSYLRDNISDYLKLESRYKDVIETMSSLRKQLDALKLTKL